MRKGKLTEHAQNLQGFDKCSLRKAVGNLGMPYGCEMTVIAQERLITGYTSKFYKLNKVIAQYELSLRPDEVHSCG